MRATDLILPEELLLLALHDRKGSLIGGSTVSYGLAGTALLELAMRERITLDGELVTVRSADPVGHPLLDDVLEVLAAAKRRRKVKGWVQALPGKLKRFHHRVAEGLVERGILEPSEEKVLWVFPVTRYPARRPGPEQAIRERVRRAVLGSRRMDARTAALAAAMSAVGLTKVVFEKPQRKDADRRIKEIVKNDVYGAAVGSVIRDIQSAIMISIIASTAATTAATSSS